MSEPFVFDSRHPHCKTPYGAVPCGTAVTLYTRPLQSSHYTSCTLVVQEEFSGIVTEYAMTLDGSDYDRDRFSIVYTAPLSGELVWYSFQFGCHDGTKVMFDKTGYCKTTADDPWQLTVYRPSHTPAWFGQGITYQIFPDRFHRLSIPDPTGMVGNRDIHSNWSDNPIWAPDEKGIVWNKDFFGGSINGIREKLSYLASLSVTTLYLCPIFESSSNHRYDTADYTAIDPMLGSEEDFRSLCAEAKSLGMHILLDGVFNHIGSQSRYFNANGFYPTLGAAQSQDSPWFPWFRFSKWPDKYESWWGINTLPSVEEDCSDYRNYIIKNSDSIIRRWLDCGADGWRLDVADELPDDFIRDIRTAINDVAPESLLLGEVWEDASNKTAYSQRRKYFLGEELHGVMNYPFRTAALDFLQGLGSKKFVDDMEQLREHYPRSAFYSAMNFLGTHDTGRILTVLGAKTVPSEKGVRAEYTLSPEEYAKGTSLVQLAALLLYTFPGSPTVYYGDEIGMEGFEDPFNRHTYPWDGQDKSLLERFTLLGQLRSAHPALQDGGLFYHYVEGNGLAYSRHLGDDYIMTICNAGAESLIVGLPSTWLEATDLLSGQRFTAQDGSFSVTVPPYGGLLLQC